MHRFLLAAASLAFALPGSAHAAAQNAAVPTDGQAAPSGELSDAVHPKGYRLDLTIDPNREDFSGRVEIDAELKSPATTIFMHGRDLTMRKASATVGGRSIPGTWREVDPTGVAQLSFTEELPAGPLTLVFEYGAAFKSAPAGLFRVKVGNDWYSWSQFQSIDARAAFPSFDQPSFKTPFTVTLRTPPGLTAVSNAPQVSQTSEDGMDVHRYRQTLPLPTYLVAMMVGPFVTAEGQVPATPQRAQPLPLRIVSTQQNADKLSFALDGSKEIVALLEDYFADAFPYPKLDQITSPIMPGAMENAGADLYGDALLIMDANAPIAQKRKFGMVVAHELGHQWFGDLVTPAWWDDIWLNESFANWMGYRIGDAWRPDLNIRAGALAEGFQAMDIDALIAGRPIRQKIATNAEINGAFDSITYGKGGHVVTMIADFMGDAKFRDGVRRYMAAHRYGNATSVDFFAAMAEVAGDPRIVPAMRSFTDQQGVPLLTFAHDGANFTVTQSRYVRFGTTAPDQLWGVPMCVRRDAERQCTLLTEKTGRFTLAGAGPLVPNAGGAGYYRFELTPADWDALIDRADTLTGGEAQAVVDSLAASIIAGRASVTQLGALARKLVNHPDSYAADAPVAALAGMAAAGIVDENARNAWRDFVDRLYTPLLTEYGLDPRAGVYAAEAPERSQRRLQVVERLVSWGRNREARRTLLDAARAYLDGDASALDPTWFDAAFGLYLVQTGATGAKALLTRALKSEDPVFRPAAMDAVATSGLQSIAGWVLNDVIDPRLRPSEKQAMLGGILLTTATREIGYRWLHRNFDTLTSGGGGIFFSRRLPQTLVRFCSVKRAEALAREFRPRFAGKAGAIELERALERVRDCGTLRDGRASQLSAEFKALK